MKKYNCNFCKKNYSSRQSLYVHKKNIHKCKDTENKLNDDGNVALLPQNVALNVAFSGQNVASNATYGNYLTGLGSNIHPEVKYICEYCSKEYKHHSSLYRHKKQCKIDYDDGLVIPEELKDDIKEIKRNMRQIINKKFKMHPKTFEKLQRDLMAMNNAKNKKDKVDKLYNVKTINNMNNSNNVNTVNNTNHITNNTQNNYNIKIIPLGKEDLVNVLSKEEQIKTVNSLYDSIKYLCDITHFNPATPQYQSFIITNMQNNIAYLYDEDKNIYKPITKEELMECLVHERGSDIRDFMEFNEDDINPRIIIRMNNFIDRLDTDKQYLKKKINELKVFIYYKTKDMNINKLNMICCS
jgi:hypothetical protein